MFKVNIRRKFNGIVVIMKVVAIVITLSFFVQDIVWADLDNALATSPAFRSEDESAKMAAMLIETHIVHCNNNRPVSELAIEDIHNALKTPETVEWLKQNGLLRVVYLASGNDILISSGGYILRYYKPGEGDEKYGNDRVVDTVQLNDGLRKQLMRTRKYTPSEDLSAIEDEAQLAFSTQIIVEEIKNDINNVVLMPYREAHKNVMIAERGTYAFYNGKKILREAARDSADKLGAVCVKLDGLSDKALAHISGELRHYSYRIKDGNAFDVVNKIRLYIGRLLADRGKIPLDASIERFTNQETAARLALAAANNIGKWGISEVEAQIVSRVKGEFKNGSGNKMYVVSTNIPFDISKVRINKEGTSKLKFLVITDSSNRIKTIATQWATPLSEDYAERYFVLEKNYRGVDLEDSEADNIMRLREKYKNIFEEWLERGRDIKEEPYYVQGPLIDIDSSAYKTGSKSSLEMFLSTNPVAQYIFSQPEYQFAGPVSFSGGVYTLESEKNGQHPYGTTYSIPGGYYCFLGVVLRSVMDRPLYVTPEVLAVHELMHHITRHRLMGFIDRKNMENMSYVAEYFKLTHPDMFKKMSGPDIEDAEELLNTLVGFVAIGADHVAISVFPYNNKRERLEINEAITSSDIDFLVKMGFIPKVFKATVSSAKIIKPVIDIGGTYTRIGFVLTEKEADGATRVLRLMDVIKISNIQKSIQSNGYFRQVTDLIPTLDKIANTMKDKLNNLKGGYAIAMQVGISAPGAWWEDGTLYRGDVPNIPELAMTDLVKEFKNRLGIGWQVFVDNDGIAHVQAIASYLLENISDFEKARKALSECPKIVGFIPGTGFGAGAFHISNGNVVRINGPQQFFDVIMGVGEGIAFEGLIVLEDLATGEGFKSQALKDPILSAQFRSEELTGSFIASLAENNDTAIGDAARGLCERAGKVLAEAMILTNEGGETGKTRKAFMDASLETTFWNDVKGSRVFILGGWLMSIPAKKYTIPVIREELNRRGYEKIVLVMADEISGVKELLDKDATALFGAALMGQRMAENKNCDHNKVLYDFLTKTANLRNIIKLPIIPTLNTSARSEGNNVLVLYADSILDQGAVVDLKSSLVKAKSHNIVSKIIIYGQNDGSAKALERIIKNADNALNTETIEAVDLGQEFEEDKELSSLISFAKRKNMFDHGNNKLLGVIKGLTGKLYINGVKNFAKQNSVPVVFFKQSEDHSIYSFREALNAILDINNKNIPFAEKWFELPPAVTISEQTKKAYDEYRSFLNSLIISA